MSADELVEKEKVLTGFRQVFDRFDVDKDGTVTEYEALKIANEILGLGLDSVVEHVVNSFCSSLAIKFIVALLLLCIII